MARQGCHEIRRGRRQRVVRAQAAAECLGGQAGIGQCVGVAAAHGLKGLRPQQGRFADVGALPFVASETSGVTSAIDARSTAAA